MTPKEYVNNFFETHPISDNCPCPKIDCEWLINLIQKYNITSVFEFGTWQGYTSLLLWEYPTIRKTATIDIHKGIETSYDHLQHPLREKEFYGSYIKDKPIKQIFCDSMVYTPTEDFEMVFIDGNHNYEYIKNDTEKALKMNPKIIVWHDYNDIDIGNTDVKEYVDGLAKLGRKVFRSIQGSIAWMEVNNDKNP